MKVKKLRQQLEARGIKEGNILKALRSVNREDFLPVDLTPYAYEDISLELEKETLLPRLYVVARWLQVLDLKPEDKILLVGSDSGYLLAVLSHLCKEVYAVDDNEQYDKWAKSILQSQQILNVFFKTGTSVEGWEEKGPFDKILVVRQMASVPESLTRQLKNNGKALMPIGPDWSQIYLEQIEKVGESDYLKQFFTDSYFIPEPLHLPRIEDTAVAEETIVREIKRHAHAFDGISDFDIEDLLERIGDARIVLMGEASHGTSEFYGMRREITKALIERRGFNIIGTEADWPDMEVVNDFIQGVPGKFITTPFRRFPQWMWRNEEFLEMAEWLRSYNQVHRIKASLYGLDLYGLENSINHILEFLDSKDKDAAAMARDHYSCISPFMREPAEYGKMVLSKQLESCERAMLEVLIRLLKERDKLDHSDAYFHAFQNAKVIIDAERYYKIMYYGGADSWNLRDLHMFHTLNSLLNYHGAGAKAVIWAHNSHIGNALATQMYSRGEINIGHLCRETYGERSYHVGFGTHAGTVAAADNWGDSMRLMQVRPSLPESYENLCHRTGIANFSLPLRKRGFNRDLLKALSKPRLERAIGVIYRPETERMSHYFSASLPAQFDEYIWFDKTKGVHPLIEKARAHSTSGLHPFAAVDE